MQKFLQIWYIHLIMPFIDLVYLFQSTKHIGSCFNCFLVFMICIYSHLSSDISLDRIILCISCSFYVPYNNYAVPELSAPANMGILDQIYLSVITPRYLKEEDM